jgi:hypothetical protein
MQKKTILFFSRCELVHLYGKLHKYLITDYNIVHVAYSDEEAMILVNDYGISNIWILKKQIQFEKEKFKSNNALIEEIDNIFIKYTDGRFNLNSSIQSDRTFLNMNYDQALETTTIYYKVWLDLFSKNKIDFFIHEPTSLMLNHIASIICKQKGCVYSTHIMVQGEADYNFIMVDYDNGYPTEFIYKYNSLTEEQIKFNKERIELFLEKFRSNYNVFFDVLGSGKPRLFFYFKIFKEAIKEQLTRIISTKKIDKGLDNIEYFLDKNRLNSKRIKNIFEYTKIKYDEYMPGEDYYFYPLHLEPEAVVLYWSDGIYSNQVKLIENIAAQLPPNIMLYVKDHPHLYGYRDVADYKRIQNIPNVKLLEPHLPGKKIVNDSIGVITLNGTAGFEALLLNKQTISFGSAFYNVSSRVRYVSNIKDFRDVIYGLKSISYEDDEELYRFVLAYLDSHKIGFTDFYGNVASEIGIDMTMNIRNVAKGLSFFFKEYDNFKDSWKTKPDFL